MAECKVVKVGEISYGGSRVDVFESTAARSDRGPHPSDEVYLKVAEEVLRTGEPVTVCVADRSTTRT